MMLCIFFEWWCSILIVVSKVIEKIISSVVIVRMVGEICLWMLFYIWCGMVC